MTRIGSNAFCTEHELSIVANRYFGYDEDQDRVYYNAQWYKRFLGTKNDMQGKIYYDIHESKIVDGINGLDREDGTWTDPSTSASWIVMLVLLIVAGIAWVYYVTVWLCCPIPNLIKPTIYIHFDEKQA